MHRSSAVTRTGGSVSAASAGRSSTVSFPRATDDAELRVACIAHRQIADAERLGTTRQQLPLDVHFLAKMAPEDHACGKQATG